MYAIYPRGVSIYGGGSSSKGVIGNPIATTLTEELLRGSSCDFQFVKASTYQDASAVNHRILRQKVVSEGVQWSR